MPALRTTYGRSSGLPAARWSSAGKATFLRPLDGSIAARIPGCELHLYEAAGHAFHWECIDDFNPRIVRWFLGA